MKIINQKKWFRRAHFQFFNQFDQPIWTATVNLKLSKDFKKINKGNINAALVYAFAWAANKVPEFRQRIRSKNKVCEHELVHPSFTVATKTNLFNFCFVKLQKSRKSFYADCNQASAKASKRKGILDPKALKENVIYMSSVPFLDFQSVTHPNPTNPPDSVPRIAWGAIQKDSKNKLSIAVNIQVHHALIDAYHAAQFFKAAGEYL